jgi:AcrR family transcriptional regulator
MSLKQRSRTRRRVPLSRQRVLPVAIKLADQGGIESLSMRNVAQELGVYPMALYNHFANKDDLLNAMVDAMYAEIGLPAEADDWKAAMRQQAASVRAVLARHRWALGVMESRSQPGPANLRYHDVVIGSLRRAGFSPAAAVQVFTLLDSYVFGFALQEQTLPFESTDQVGEVAAEILSQVPTADYPNLAEAMAEYVGKPGYDFGDEFEFGLEVVLGGLERYREFG